MFLLSPIQRTYFCVHGTDGAARIYFFLSLISPGTCHLMAEDYSLACQRERGKKNEEEEKKPRIKPLCLDRDLNPQTLSPEPSMLSIRPRHPAQCLDLILTFIKSPSALSQFDPHRQEKMSKYIRNSNLPTYKTW